MSKCVYLACMAVKIERTVGCHNHDILQQCISDVYASQVWASTRLRLAKIYAFSIETSLHAWKINKNKFCSI